jgi:hypothetical protein
VAQKMTPEILLSIWEDSWGRLNIEWRGKFLSDNRIKEILKFPEASIHMGVAKFNKLDSVLDFLNKTSTPDITQIVTVAEVESKPGFNNAIKRMQLERALEPKIPDQDWWRGK